jgi:hypothetical protein
VPVALTVRWWSPASQRGAGLGRAGDLTQLVDRPVELVSDPADLRLETVDVGMLGELCHAQLRLSETVAAARRHAGSRSIRRRA